MPSRCDNRRTTLATVRQILRSLRRQPATTVIAVLTLALGIGATTAIGAALLIRSFVSLQGLDPGYRTSGIPVMYAHAPASTRAEYQQATRAFERLTEALRTLPGVRASAAAMGLPTGQYNASGAYMAEGREAAARPGDRPTEAGFRLTTPGYFDAMGIPLRRGRDFDARDAGDAEGRPSSSPAVAIISAALAQESFPGVDPLRVLRAD